MVFFVAQIDSYGHSAYNRAELGDLKGKLNTSRDILHFILISFNIRNEVSRKVSSYAPLKILQLLSETFSE